jgi:hypothetical protein
MASKPALKTTGLSLKQIHTKMLEDAARSDLDAADVRKLRFEPMSANEALGLKLPSATDGYAIPYFDLDGKPTSFIRVRYLADTRKGFAQYTKKKVLKYAQVPGTVSEVYLPPLLNWRAILAKNIPLVFTEGEKKAACATKSGIPTIGLGGVWSFMSSKKNIPLLPIFKEMNLADRDCIVCFDSDAALNPGIVAAELRFAQRLLEEGATVKIARIPQEGDAKVGMDDYILAHGAAEFKKEVLDTAFEYTPSKALHKLNASVVYIRDPGLLYDYEHKMKISAAQFTQHSHSNLFHSVKTVTADGTVKNTRTATAKAWMEWEHRAELRGLVYRPGAPQVTEDGFLNGWLGWGFEAPKKGNVEPWSALLDHLFGNNKGGREWFERWCAYPIQNPGAKMASAALMWGAAQGTGKTLVGHTLMKLYGKNSTEIKDQDLESPRFEWAENKQFVLADDITGSTNRKLANRLKTMITQKEMRLDPKYVPSYTIQDCINYYFTSNDPDALFLDDGDRRFFVHEVMAGKLPVEQRKAYVAWMESTAGHEALAWHLINLDIGDFDPRAEAYETSAKLEMKIVAKSELGVWVAKLKEDPERLLNGVGGQLGDLLTAEELHAVFDPAGDKRASPNALAREMKRAGFFYPSSDTPLRTKDGIRRAYVVKNVEKWRNAPWGKAVEHFESHREMIKPGEIKQRKY